MNLSYVFRCEDYRLVGCGAVVWYICTEVLEERGFPNVQSSIWSLLHSLLSPALKMKVADSSGN
jgi:hypothetical protein